MNICKPVEVPYTFEDIKVGEVYEIHVENIFDPSKLWIIVNFKELNIFTEYLKIHYGNDENRIKIPKFKLQRSLVCIIQRNCHYYRAVVLPLLLPGENKIRVFLLDYGSFINVDLDNIFYILQKHCAVPRFALRACLIYVAPPSILIILL